LKKSVKTSILPEKPASISTFLTLVFLEGLIAFAILASIPSDNEAGILFGLSASRLALLVGHIILLLIAAYFLFIDRRLKYSLLNKYKAHPSGQKEKWLGLAAVLLMAACFLILQILLSLYLTTGSFREYAYYQRLLPTLGWLILIGLQTLLTTAFIKRRAIAAAVKSNRAALIPTLIVFLLFFAAALFASITGIGLVPDKYGWGAPAVALMEWQIWFSIAFALLASALLRGTLTANVSLTRKDLFICLGIWLAAVVIWGTQPVPPGFFATPGRAPNFEIYPFSDGAFYDFYAQNILIGNGFRGAQIPPRPLYILFLAVAHAIAGQNYNLVVLVQTLVLALIPVVVYLLGRTFHSTAAGLAAAAMVILRELTAIIATPFTDDISNSKLLFADLPSTLGIALVLLLVFLWLKQPWKRSGLPMAAGLAMGLLLLVRTQSLLIVPVIFLAALIVYRRRLVQLAVSFGLFLLTMGLCIAPWLIRNDAIAGQFIFDHPESQSRVMAQHYDFNGDFDSLERRPDEGTGDYSSRLSTSIQRTILDHPLYVAQFVTAHFINNEIGDLLILPLRNGLSSPAELIFPSAPFWQEWNGHITWKQGLLLAANLLIISLGIGVSWKKHKILGLLPLLVNLTYNLSTAVARFSGWRYLLPVDWIACFYYVIGLVALLSTIFSRVKVNLNSPSEIIAEIPSKPVFPAFPSLFAFFVIAILCGSSLVLAEKIIPYRYENVNPTQVLREMTENPHIKSSGIDLQALSVFYSHPGAFITKGKALYPRFYFSGEGEAKTAKTGYAPSPDSRLVFLVASRPDGLTIFNTNSPPEYFPNGADISIVGCQHDLYAEAWIITVHGSQDITYISPAAGELDCIE
jgi:hypothetical protein